MATAKKQIQDDKQLMSEIKLFQTNQEKIEAIEKEIKPQLDQLKALDKENKTRFKEIQKFMQRFKIRNKQVGKIIATLEEKLKYKVPRPDYKAAWTEALTKVNAATRAVLDAVIEAQMELKRKATQDVLTIKSENLDEGLRNGLKLLMNKIKNLFISFGNYFKVTQKLPKV